MLLSDSATRPPLLPIIGVEELQRRGNHTPEALERFHAEHRALLRHSVLLLAVPDEEPVAEYAVLGLHKQVYTLDRRQYVFLSRDDYMQMKQRSRDELAAFLARHHGCLFKILPETDQATLAEERVLVKRKREDTEDDETVEIRVRLALLERERERDEMEHARELERLEDKHQQELRLLRAELTVEALIKQLQLRTAQQANLMRTKKQFLQSVNQYGQDLSRLQLHNGTRWFNLFQNPEITLERLHAAVYVERLMLSGPKSLRLIVPVTYRYSLRRIIQCLAEAQEQQKQSHVKALLDACPPEYRVVLFGGPHLPEVKHSVNCSILALHLHLIRRARQIQREAADAGKMWTVKLCDQEAGQVSHLTPSADLMAAHYPAAVYSGMGTYLLPDMTMPVCYVKPASSSSSSASVATQSEKTAGKKSRRAATKRSPSEGMGTGQGKLCPFCSRLSRMLIQGNNYKKAHQLINCPFIALHSQNEAAILETLRLRCIIDAAPGQGKKCNRLAEHAFLVGQEAKRLPGGDLEFVFDSQSLWRQATPEEMQAGEHDNGLRLNRRRYMKMRRDVHESLGTQIFGPLFDQVDTHAQHLLRALYDMEAVDERSGALPPLRDLLYDETDRKFLDGRYDKLTKRALRNFEDSTEDGLYFTLDSGKVRSLATEHFMQLYQHECLQQQIFLGGGAAQQQQQQQSFIYG